MGEMKVTYREGMFLFANLTVKKVRDNERLTKGEIEFMADALDVLVSEGEFTDLMEQRYLSGQYN